MSAPQQVLFGINQNQDSTLLTGILAYWKFDESSGNATDSSGNSETLTNIGTMTFVSGKINNGIQSASGKNMQKTADNIGLSSGGDYSWSFWVNFSAFTSGYVFRHRTASGANRDNLVYVSGSGEVRMYASGNEITDSGLSTSTWYHFVVTKTGTTFELFTNTVSQGTTTQGTSGAALNQISIGGDIDGSTSLLTGVIDEFGVWDRALSSAEISELYNGGSGNQYPF
ncbi:LamG domain-containing protein [Candidatus Dojkabacteria bacterium]|uniref:LamG domain-containing protein n=1 Tax=Candidatus Dojkabacteria bacterium TaxID=2099670 RepID=A0A5C7J8E0_9BACT|nr:MAG: LamG domain-containing protein [Candidatus Dojkabacteria bacterium]